MAFKSKYTPEQWQQVDELLQAGASVRETSNTTGVPYASIYQRMRRAADPKPGGNRERKPRTVKPTEPISDEKLQAMVARIAVAPAPVAKLWLRCDYCAVHFAQTADPLSAELVSMSHEYPALRDLLESLHKQWAKAAWGALLIGWLGVPIMHHTLPPDVFSTFALLLGAVQDDADAPRYAPPPPSTNGHHTHPPEPEPVPEPTPFETLDIDQLYEQARAAGIRFDMPGVGPEPVEDVIIDIEEPIATAPTETAETAAENPDATEAETVTSDTDDSESEA